MSSSNFSWLTMLNAFERSNWRSSVRFAGFFGLKPEAFVWLNWLRAVTVEWDFRKPCWMSEISKVELRIGRRILFRTLMAGQRSETGRKEEDSWAGLLGFKRGTMVDILQMEGTLLVETDKLKSWVRNVIPFGPFFCQKLLRIFRPNVIEFRLFNINSLLRRVKTIFWYWSVEFL